MQSSFFHHSSVFVLWRLAQLKRKKLDAIEDKAEDARKKGRKTAEETAADANAESDQESSDSELAASFVDNLHKLADNEVGMFLDYFDCFKPCKKVFEINDLKLGKLYDQLGSRNSRSQMNPEDATNHKSQVFLQSEVFPENLRPCIDTLMYGPQIVQEKLLTKT